MGAALRVLLLPLPAFSRFSHLLFCHCLEAKHPRAPQGPLPLSPILTQAQGNRSHLPIEGLGGIPQEEVRSGITKPGQPPGAAASHLPASPSLICENGGAAHNRIHNTRQQSCESKTLSGPQAQLLFSEAPLPSRSREPQASYSKPSPTSHHVKSN